MFVVKRNGEKHDMHFEKITNRIKKLLYGLDTKHCDAAKVAQKVIKSIFSGITTEEIDVLSAETAAYMSTVHPDYGILAARIAISNLHKKTLKSFSQVILQLREAIHDGNHTPLVSDRVAAVVAENATRLDAAIVYDRDMDYDYFGFKTLEKSYLMRINKVIVERPQHMLMRVAVGIHHENIDKVLETYDLMSRRAFTHATPTLYSAGTPKPQMSSCFLLTMKDDSISGIYETIGKCAEISKHAGGIGLNATGVRAKGSYIKGTNGHSNGLVPMLRVFDATARYVDQGGGKRRGSIAIFLEPWHADIEEFLKLKLNTRKPEDSARDLFYGLWIPDLFMKRVEENGHWSLFCPNIAKGLNDVFGDEFERLYLEYEKQGCAFKVVRAQEIWNLVLTSQIETGTPYMLYKDACNKKNNQMNLGPLRCSNLCTEILQYTSPGEIAVCNLASINLSWFVGPKGFDFKELMRVTKIVVENLNSVIDNNYYPVPESRESNMKHRPIGVGVQGLANTFLALRMPFDSPEAKVLNRDIFEHIYFAACQKSMELATLHGPYSSFQGSPASRGELQFHLWGQKPNLPWDELITSIKERGLYNSLMVALMPTASTSQVLSQNECFEPFTSNIYSRKVLAGDFIVVNNFLVKDLIALGMWNTAMKDEIINHRGSIQAIKLIPVEIKALYKTVWEISQKVILEMAADRGAFVDQSQSMNIHMEVTNSNKLSSMHFAAWRLGLKTGMYYLRTKSKVNPIQFSQEGSICEKKEDCDSCGS